MRPTILFAFITLLLCSASAQDTTSSVVKKTYGGVLATGLYDGKNYSNSGNLMIGAEGKFPISDTSIYFRSRVAYVSNASPVTHFFIVSENEIGSIIVGTFPRPISNTRPNPAVSPDGQDETNGTKIIPGAATGVEFNFNMKDSKNRDSSTIASLGFYDPNGKREFDLGVDALFDPIQNLRCGYALVWGAGDHVGFSFFLKQDRFCVIDYIDRNSASLYSEIRCFDGRFYADGVYGLNQEKLSSCELGWRKEYKQSFLSTILGVGYDIKQNAAKIFVLTYM